MAPRRNMVGDSKSYRLTALEIIISCGDLKTFIARKIVEHRYELCLEDIWAAYYFSWRQHETRGTRYRYRTQLCKGGRFDQNPRSHS